MCLASLTIGSNVSLLHINFPNGGAGEALRVSLVLVSWLDCWLGKSTVRFFGNPSRPPRKNVFSSDFLSDVT